MVFASFRPPKRSDVQGIDFSRSFLTFRLDTLKHPPRTVTQPQPFTLNNARIPLECRCLIRERDTNRQEEFVLGASCKTERVGVDCDIWPQPNADFAPIYSLRQFAHVKTYDRAGRTVPLYPPSLGQQSERPSGLCEGVFDAVRIDLCRVDAELLTDVESIIESTLNNWPLVARTRLETPRYVVELDYPIKTINVSERDAIYQTDTGPVLLPDLSRDFDQMLDGLELAYCAFNNPGWIEFLVRAPSEVAPGVSVYHYCKPQRFTAQNQVLRLVSQREIVRESKHAEVCA